MHSIFGCKTGAKRVRDGCAKPFIKAILRLYIVSEPNSYTNNYHNNI